MIKQQLFRFPALLLLTVVVSGLLLSCSTEADEPKPDKSIVELAQSTPDLSILVTALTKYPDLVTTLSGDGSFTVFAPTNAAFTSLLTAIG
ncbi:MAG: fasciclin domain-containing protein [Bacteroidetes bacterium]|nr:fasciclin domain-containing protein [Bacteroidota bacterium]